MIVPSGVLSILPGYGPTTGKAIVSNPLIRKVDVTVSRRLRVISPLYTFLRLALKLVVLWEVSLVLI